VAALYGQEGASIERRMDELLDLFELTDWKHELVESYSHGMRQKLIISSAMLHRPEFIVVDEADGGARSQGCQVPQGSVPGLREAGRHGPDEHPHARSGRRHVRSDRHHPERQIAARGTMAELRIQTSSGDATLEELFLKLTGGIIDRELDSILEA